MVFSESSLGNIETNRKTQLLSKQTLLETCTCKGHPRPTHHPREFLNVTERRSTSFFLEFVKVLGTVTVR